MGDILFYLNSVLLGIGLAMDAFSVSIANGISEPNMKKGRLSLIAGTYGLFQFAMPMIGWLCIKFLLSFFESFEKFIPYIALILLLYIGGKMIIENIKENKEDSNTENDDSTKEIKKKGFLLIFIQGIATSIDALSVGFTIEQYDALMAVISSLIIGIVTFIICVLGLALGNKIGSKFKRAELIGGIILIAIGIEIFVKGVFF